MDGPRVSSNLCLVRNRGTVEASFDARTGWFFRQPHTDVIVLVDSDPAASAVDPDPEDRSVRNHVIDCATHEHLSFPLNVHPVPRSKTSPVLRFQWRVFGEGGISAISLCTKRSATWGPTSLKSLIYLSAPVRARVVRGSSSPTQLLFSPATLTRNVGVAGEARCILGKMTAGSQPGCV